MKCVPWEPECARDCLPIAVAVLDSREHLRPLLQLVPSFDKENRRSGRRLNSHPWVPVYPADRIPQRTAELIRGAGKPHEFSARPLVRRAPVPATGNRRDKRDVALLRVALPVVFFRRDQLAVRELSVDGLHNIVERVLREGVVMLMQQVWLVSAIQ